MLEYDKMPSKNEIIRVADYQAISSGIIDLAEVVKISFRQ